jgi:hypothetical protein
MFDVDGWRARWFDVLPSRREAMEDLFLTMTVVAGGLTATGRRNG